MWKVRRQQSFITLNKSEVFTTPKGEREALSICVYQNNVFSVQIRDTLLIAGSKISGVYFVL